MLRSAKSEAITSYITLFFFTFPSSYFPSFILNYRSCFPILNSFNYTRLVCFNSILNLHQELEGTCPVLKLFFFKFCYFLCPSSTLYSLLLLGLISFANKILQATVELKLSKNKVVFCNDNEVASGIARFRALNAEAMTLVK